jgi:hypothetical protein
MVEVMPRPIVGVVGEIRFPGSLTKPITRFQIYRPLPHEPRSYATITVRAPGDATPTIRALRQAVAELDPGLPLYDTGTISAAVHRELANFSLIAWIWDRCNRGGGPLPPFTGRGEVGPRRFLPRRAREQWNARHLP